MLVNNVTSPNFPEFPQSFLKHFKNWFDFGTCNKIKLFHILLWIFERSICWCCDDLFLKWKWWFKSKVKLSFILHHHFVLGSLLLHVMSHYNYHNDDCYVGTWVFFSQITFLQRIAPLNTAATTQFECWVTLLGIAPDVIKHQSRQALTKTE